MPLPYRHHARPQLKTPEEELEFMQAARRRGLLPNPHVLTEERAEWAQGMENLIIREDRGDYVPGAVFNRDDE